MLCARQAGCRPPLTQVICGRLGRLLGQQLAERDPCGRPCLSSFFPSGIRSRAQILRMLTHLALIILSIGEGSSCTYLCNGHKDAGHHTWFEAGCTDRRREISFAVWDHWRWRIVPQARKGAACVSLVDQRGPGVDCVPLHAAGGAGGRSAILETARPVQMDVCGPEAHECSTEELMKAESGMARIGGEDWTTSRSFCWTLFASTLT